MRTRSSANYSHHVPISTSTTTTTIPAAAAANASTNRTLLDTNTAFSGSGADLDDIMAAKNEAIQKLMRSYRAHLHEKFVVRCETPNKVLIFFIMLINQH